MARLRISTTIRVLALVLAMSGLAACNYGGSPSGSAVSADSGNGTPPPQPVSAQLAWNAATGPVAGYRVYESRNGGSFGGVQNVSQAAVTVEGMPGDTLQIQVAALDAAGNQGPMSQPSPLLAFENGQVVLAPPSANALAAAPAGGSAQLSSGMAQIAGGTAQVASAGAAAPDGASPANADDAVGSSPASDDLAAARLDMSGDGATDLLWESTVQDVLRVTDADGEVLAVFDRPAAEWELVAMADLDGDGLSDLLWARDSGALALSRMAPSLMVQPALDMAAAGDLAAEEWVRATGDFDGDGAAEVLVQDAGSQALAIWSLSASGQPDVLELGLAPAAGQELAGSRDYDGDARDDLLLQGADGSLSVWLLDSGGVRTVATLAAAAGGEVLASGDFDGDGRADVARRDIGGGVELLLLGNGLDAPSAMAGLASGAALEPMGAGDYDGDGRSDLLWLDGSGNLVVWFMDPGLVIDAVTVAPDSGWSLFADWR